MLRTCSDLQLNLLTSRHPWDSSWYTTTVDAWPWAAPTTMSPTAFLANRYTFVNPTEPADELQTLQLAVKLATKLIRSVHLMTDTMALRGRIHCLKINISTFSPTSR